MSNKSVILCVAMGIALVVAILGILKHKMNLHHADDPIAGALIAIQSPVDVLKINVLNGHEFDICLNDDRRIHAILDVESSSDAKKHVVEFLNRCTKPRVVLKKQKDDKWVVQLYVTATDANNQAVEISLSQWLKEKKLVYE